MTDKELLELAAKAAGIDAEFHSDGCYESEGMWLKGERSPDNSKYWNPLTDDGDALRLAVKVDILDHPLFRHFFAVETLASKIEPYAATRRAIVRAAAEIGKAIP